MGTIVLMITAVMVGASVAALPDILKIEKSGVIVLGVAILIYVWSLSDTGSWTEPFEITGIEYVETSEANPLFGDPYEYYYYAVGFDYYGNEEAFMCVTLDKDNIEKYEDGGYVRIQLNAYNELLDFQLYEEKPKEEVSSGYILMKLLNVIWYNITGFEYNGNNEYIEPYSV